MTETKSVTALIAGRVQGVGYRDWTRREAVTRGISGWVRNRDDGTVEAAFSGPAAAVDTLIEDCYAGPPGAHVAHIVIAAGDAVSGSTGFAITR